MQASETGLTDRQERFVHEYLIDHNASAAALRAGYSAKTRGAQAAELMNNPKVYARIVCEQGDLFARLKVHAAELMLAHVRAAYFDPAKLYDSARQPVPLHELDADTRGALTVHYDLRPDGGCYTRVRQAPRHIALAALQKQHDQWQQMQQQAWADAAEQEAQEARERAPAPPGANPFGRAPPSLAQQLFGIKFDEILKAPQPFAAAAPATGGAAAEAAAAWVPAADAAATWVRPAEAAASRASPAEAPATHPSAAPGRTGPPPQPTHQAGAPQGATRPKWVRPEPPKTESMYAEAERRVQAARALQLRQGLR